MSDDEKVQLVKMLADYISHPACELDAESTIEELAEDIANGIPGGPEAEGAMTALMSAAGICIG